MPLRAGASPNGTLHRGVAGSGRHRALNRLKPPKPSAYINRVPGPPCHCRNRHASCSRIASICCRVNHDFRIAFCWSRARRFYELATLDLRGSPTRRSNASQGSTPSRTTSAAAAGIALARSGLSSTKAISLIAGGPGVLSGCARPRRTVSLRSASIQSALTNRRRPRDSSRHLAKGQATPSRPHGLPCRAGP
jgi:hypothetical protein